MPDEPSLVDFIGDATPEKPPRPRRQPRRQPLLVLAAGAAALLLIVLAGGRGDRPRPALRIPVPATSTTVAPPDRYPERTLQLAVGQLCRNLPRCPVRINDPAQLADARRTFGRVRDLQVRTTASGSLVAALMPDGVQLLAVVSRPGYAIVPTALQIIPPLAVQTQPNGPDRLTAIISGTPDAVALLARPSVQRWLAALRT